LGLIAGAPLTPIPPSFETIQVAPAAGCRASVYLTLDTGTMRHADLIAAILDRHAVKATFFLANETTIRGDAALDDSWIPFWRSRVAEGHAFGSHTWRHGRFVGDLAAPDGAVRYRPQVGENAGETLKLEAQGVCAEIERVNQRFRTITGRALDPWWRAPGGIVTPNALRAGQACGWTHVGWAPAGFLGDELPSEQASNDALVKRALARVRDGDILMAHLGIRSRRDPFAPALEPLIAGLKARGFCFATLPRQ
jgi:peptidoglycan/xylan/chitin deacetylase (PgdA/CDA1 family)